MAVDLCLLLILFLLTLLFFLSRPPSTQNLPPSPPFPLPLIGHLHLLRRPVCHSLRRLSHSLGPIFSLRFGSRLVAVVSSAAAAEDCFSQNDVVLANRPHILAGDIVGYNHATLIEAPYGPRWRSLRKICSNNIFSPLRLSSSSQIRAQAVSDLVRKIAQSSLKAVALRPLLKVMMFEILMNTFAGGGEVSGRFIDTIGEVLKRGETANPADFVAGLKWINFVGFQRKLKKVAAVSDGLLQDILDRRRQICRSGNKRDNLVDNLLESQKSEPDLYDDKMIKALLLILFGAGADTSAVSIEWGVSLLLNNPDALRKAKNEIDLRIGESRPVEEADLPNLPYLRSVISETLRIYPPVPLLLPHYSSEDCTVAGYNIPRDTIVFVNALAIHRDPEVWEAPMEFRPERFEGGDMSVYKYMPFGVGRRSCPGAGMADLVVALAMASLIQCFEWERCGGEEEVDMREGDGLTMPKAEPLEAIFKARPIVDSFITKFRTKPFDEQARIFSQD